MDDGPESPEEVALDFHPQAVRPNFLWTAKLPTHWAFLDTHPSRWKRQLDRIVEEYFAGRRAPAAERRILLRHLEQLVQGAQNQKVLFTFLMPGVVREGEVSACTVFLRWQNSSPTLASLRDLEATFGPSKELVHYRTGAGDPYVAFSETGKTGPLTDRRPIFHHQAFVPIPTTTWTLAVAGSAPTEETSQHVRDVVLRIANSIRAYPETTGQRILGDPESGELRSDGTSAVRYVSP
ncbi:hypothetical protein DLJ54_07920 [Corynebacterium heidelbergense]|uniref:Uncharacterized protein n=1 Tax=Corynebacterium heidelbergense TaxID=2055947 RepID=A0A364V4G8_9CORY|nr:hypothetical protein DLJ54_07920 [Corynebacterium heidelbergense]